MAMSASGRTSWISGASITVLGTVFLAVAGPTCEVVEVRLPGDRDRVRALTVQSAMHLLRKHVTR